jgi:hypothetical protein
MYNSYDLHQKIQKDYGRLEKGKSFIDYRIDLAEEVLLYLTANSR